MTFGGDPRPRSSLAARQGYSASIARDAEEAHALPVRATALMASDLERAQDCVTVTIWVGPCGATADTTPDSVNRQETVHSILLLPRPGVR
jgi:hypothetical protein